MIVTSDNKPLYCFEFVAYIFDQVSQPFFYNYRLGAAVVEYILEIIRQEAKIERHQYRAEQRRAKECFEHTVAILREHRHAVALSDSQTAYRIGPAVNALAELAICEPGIAANDSFFACMRDERALKKVKFIERNDHDYTSGFYGLNRERGAG